jgi:beta-N-acetylhexosaminidase
MVDLRGVELDAEERELLQHPLVGSVILFTRNFADGGQLSRLIADIRAVRSPALLVAVDHEGGRVQRFRKGFSQLPAARMIGRRYDVDRQAGLELARASGWLMAAELRAFGIDLSFAPVTDLDYGVNEVIGDRAFHRDPDAVAALAGAYMAGMRDAGMAATAKHFPGHGAVIADSHVTLPVDRRPFAELERDLIPYRRLIANGLAAVMMAHIVFSEIDPLPASLSSFWVRKVLREDLRFHGAVFTDDLGMQAAAAGGSMLERARQALSVGCDVLPVCNDRAGVLALLDGLKQGPEPASFARLARLRGRPATLPGDLFASEEWRRSADAVARSFAQPELRLDA